MNESNWPAATSSLRATSGAVGAEQHQQRVQRVVVGDHDDLDLLAGGPLERVLDRGAVDDLALGEAGDRDLAAARRRLVVAPRWAPRSWAPRWAPRSWAPRWAPRSWAPRWAPRSWAPRWAPRSSAPRCGSSVVAAGVGVSVPVSTTSVPSSRSRKNQISPPTSKTTRTTMADDEAGVGLLLRRLRGGPAVPGRSAVPRRTSARRDPPRGARRRSRGDRAAAARLPARSRAVRPAAGPGWYLRAAAALRAGALRAGALRAAETLPEEAAAGSRTAVECSSSLDPSARPDPSPPRAARRHHPSGDRPPRRHVRGRGRW